MLDVAGLRTGRVRAAAGKLLHMYAFPEKTNGIHMRPDVFLCVRCLLCKRKPLLPPLKKVDRVQKRRLCPNVNQVVSGQVVSGLLRQDSNRKVSGNRVVFRECKDSTGVVFLGWDWP